MKFVTDALSWMIGILLVISVFNLTKAYQTQKIYDNVSRCASWDVMEYMQLSDSDRVCNTSGGSVTDCMAQMKATLDRASAKDLNKCIQAKRFR
jgi:hypothetical protein